jgi:hypothetical protein
MLSKLSLSSLDFIDSTRLLFTFHTSKLLTREDADRSDDDQLIHATVLALPDGHVAAASDWRMHDRSQYLWHLGGGRFLVRQGSLYSIADASLTLKPWLTASSGVVASEVSPDGQLLVSEEQYERHTPEEHKKLADEAKEAGLSPPGEDTEINIVEIDSGRLLGHVRVELPVVLPIVRSGYLKIGKGKDGGDDYPVQFASFAGGEIALGSVRSTCLPRETFLNEKAVMIQSCGPNDEDPYLDTWTIDGKKLWSGRRDGHAVWPTFALSENGNRFAVGLLRVLQKIDLDESLDDENVKEQMVQVFDVESGALLLGVNASPIVSAGQNFALSPDGNHLAVLRDGAIEVYAVPSAPNTPNTPNAPGKKDK